MGRFCTQAQQERKSDFRRYLQKCNDNFSNEYWMSFSGQRSKTAGSTNRATLSLQGERYFKVGSWGRRQRGMLEQRYSPRPRPSTQEGEEGGGDWRNANPAN